MAAIVAEILEIISVHLEIVILRNVDIKSILKEEYLNRIHKLNSGQVLTCDTANYTVVRCAKLLRLVTDVNDRNIAPALLCKHIVKRGKERCEDLTTAR